MLFPKKQVDNRKKNTKREIRPEVAEQVKARDKVCIICGEEPIEEIHHVFFGLEAQFDEGRNNADRLVGLGRICHHKLHFKGGNDYREFCISYVKQYEHPYNTFRKPI